MTNPYTLLRVTPDAAHEEIEAAYERLFDTYEPRAHAGDAEAIALLEELNEAFDALSDPERRAAIDAELEGEAAQEPARPTRRRSTYARPEAGARPQSRGRSGSDVGRTGRAAQTVKTRQRARSGSRGDERPVLPLVPILLIGLLAFGLAIAITYYFVTRGSGAQTENRGAVVATVNGQPIYEQDYLERVEMDKQSVLNDPIMGPYLQSLTPFSQTQVLETFKSDSLDRLINFEVLMQQARKEGLYPTTEAQQRSLIEETKGREVTGVSFEEFLRQRNITEGQYNRRIIRNVVYTVMADAHAPKTGTEEERRNAFFQWICQTRQSYTVKINITFSVQNPPCTSDLPPELPMPGVETTVPEPEGTTVPATPQGPVGPPAAPTPTK